MPVWVVSARRSAKCGSWSSSSRSAIENRISSALLEVFVVAHVVCCYIVGVAAGVDGDEGTEEHTKL
jgi:hypothetical protein